MNERVMPSSQSSTVTALSMAVGFSEGFGSSYFATAVILAAVVMYDAFGVRLHAGRQAEEFKPTVLLQATFHLARLHVLDFCQHFCVLHIVAGSCHVNSSCTPAARGTRKPQTVSMPSRDWEPREEPMMVSTTLDAIILQIEELLGAEEEPHAAAFGSNATAYSHA